MNSQANTSRLHRMSRVTSSIRRNSNSSFDAKDNFKLAAINSIRRGVKHNDISFISKGDISMVNKEGGNTVDLASFRTQQNYDKIRKDYDALQKEKMQLEKLLSKMKEQLQHAKEEEQIYFLKRHGAAKNVEQIQSVLKQKQDLLEQASINIKCYTNMIDRLKADKIFNKDKKRKLDNLFLEMKKQYSIIMRQGVSQQDQVYKATVLQQMLHQQVFQEQQKREEQIQSIVNQIQMLKQTEQREFVRSKQIKEIRQRANQDKSQQQNTWRQLLHSHYLVRSLLKSKMDREMQKFKLVESAFRNIKLATGVDNVKQIVNKYMNRESVYGNLLDNIANKQKYIEELKKIRQSLTKQIKDEINNSQIIEYKKTEDFGDDLKVLEIYAQKKLKTELERVKFVTWTKRQLKKIMKIQNNQSQAFKQKGQKAYFEKYVDWLEKQLENYGNESTEVSEQLYRDVQFGAEQVMRVKQQESFEEQNNSLHFEDENYLNAIRNSKLKQGEKFMKDLKKRKQQQLKIQIQMSSLRKVASPTKKQKEPQ